MCRDRLDMQPMRMVEHPGTEAHQQISQWAEFGNRVQHGADAIDSPTPVEHPQALAIAIEHNLGGETHPPPSGAFSQPSSNQYELRVAFGCAEPWPVTNANGAAQPSAPKKAEIENFA
jgi:hypothetical protein